MFREVVLGTILALTLAGCTAMTAIKTPLDISDYEITILVKGRLSEYPALQSLQVYTVDGRVILAGQVSTPEERKQAEDVAKNTRSVRQVRNQISVKSPK